MPQFDCTICLQPVSMREERASNRVWDTDIEPGGWCHRSCWETEHAEPGSMQAIIRDIFNPTAGGLTRQTIAAQRVHDEDALRVRRPTP